jgi:uncharacterized protein (DUF302 family)
MTSEHSAATVGTTVHLPVGFEQAVERVRETLRAEGFGVLTEVDVRAAFREKLDRDFRPYVILGACNPPLAYRALNEDPRVGLLLPCNVTVEDDLRKGSIVRLVDPLMLLAGSTIDASPEIHDVATDAARRLKRVAEVLRAGA